MIWFWKNKHNQRTVLCKCDCWKDVVTKKYNIAHWQESCSCKQYEDNKIRSYKHWMSWTWKWNKHDRFYNIFYWIKWRTNWKPLRKQDKCYEWIKCLWKNFEEFKNDMYDSYIEHVKAYWEKDTTIDRINWNLWYCKENCRWATVKEQAMNKKCFYTL